MLNISVNKYLVFERERNCVKKECFKMLEVRESGSERVSVILLM